SVKKILGDLGVADRPTLHVWNKMDLLAPEERAELRKSSGNAENNSTAPILVSAARCEGLQELLLSIDQTLPADPVVKLSLRLPLSEGRTLALVHALGRVIHSEVEDSHMLLDAEVPVSMARRLKLRDFVLQGTSVPQFSSH